ncbi:MAG: RdgB/HAM1 family non-canonical purine NTP pyrophosphatase [Intestinibacillus sp.]
MREEATEFVLASHNAKKLRELREILGTLEIAVSALPEGAPEPEENGDTFEENALIKARAACRLTGKPALADDSGLCVDALGGAPGVYSARYGSAAYCVRYPDGFAVLPPDAADTDRTLRLLRAMETVPSNRRQARFVSAIACVFPDGREFTVRGECEGEIAHQVHGEGGFGYVPVFFVPAYGKTFGELSPETKNRISHRSRALQNCLVKLREVL